MTVHPPDIRAHRDALIAFLETRLPGAVFKSYSAAKEGTTPRRYAVLFVALSSRAGARYTAGQSRDTYTVTVHCIGDDEDSSLYVAEKVASLTGVTLTVTSRKLQPARYITSQPPDLDDDGPDPLWFAVTQFDIISDPA